MASPKKARLNLYISSQLLDFAKKWSYVTGQPISAMLEGYLQQQRDRVTGISPFQWLNDQGGILPLAGEEKSGADLEAYLFNPEEEEFCRLNPDHPRARMRRKLLSEYEQSQSEEREKRKRFEREFISRWIEVFPVK